MNIMNKNTLQPKNLAKDNGDFSLLGDRSLSNLEAQTRNMQDFTTNWFVRRQPN